MGNRTLLKILLWGMVGLGGLCRIADAGVLNDKRYGVIGDTSSVGVHVRIAYVMGTENSFSTISAGWVYVDLDATPMLTTNYIEFSDAELRAGHVAQWVCGSGVCRPRGVNGALDNAQACSGPLHDALGVIHDNIRNNRREITSDDTHWMITYLTDWAKTNLRSNINYKAGTTRNPGSAYYSVGKQTATMEFTQRAWVTPHPNGDGLKFGAFCIYDATFGHTI
ncbi:hypothetical protein AAH559_005022 [Salmonella enterica]